VNELKALSCKVFPNVFVREALQDNGFPFL
jgi:hypothetical protein